MKKLILITVLMLTKAVYAHESVPNLSHWQPALHIDLYNAIKEVKFSEQDSVEKIQSENENALNMFKTEDSDVSRKKYISVDDAYGMLKKMKTHPVIGHDHHDFYDPTGHYGFCFGRATWAWLEAIKLGIDKKSIKKIFLVGPMRTDNINWQYHVATAVRSRGFFRDKWLVIDSNLGRVVDVEHFFKYYNELSVDKKLRLIVSDPQRLGPNSTKKFGPEYYNNPRFEKNYVNYFNDLLSNFSKEVSFERTNLCKYLF